MAFADKDVIKGKPEEKSQPQQEEMKRKPLNDGDIWVEKK